VRPIETVWVYDTVPERLQGFITELAGKGPVPKDVRPAQSPQQAAHNADIICTATTSKNPVFADADLKTGVHINGVGSYTPEMCEVPAETVTRALVVVDSREAALAEAGDLIQPIQRGVVTEKHIHAELGELVLGSKSGRTNSEQVTLFKTVGLAVEDVAAARLALERAQHLGLGQRVEL
jgi:ornithine cyclodeaminase